jgi:23S rRNA (guanine745-N1)-methyltransferase
MCIRDSLKKAGKRSRNVRYLAASIHDLPIQDASVDLTLNIFAPLFLDEITRVLRPGGCALFVLPNEDHLLELKEALYPVVRLNPAAPEAIEGFETIGVDDVSFVMNLSNQDLLHLLQMTPYVHKSPKESLDRLKTLESLHVRASFRILCVTKIVKKDA